jgi:hypothetical protein
MVPLFSGHFVNNLSPKELICSKDWIEVHSSTLMWHYYKIIYNNHAY